MKKRTKLKDRTLPNYTKGEEIANMVTHIIGGVIGIVALVLCVVFAAKNKNVYGIVSGSIFGAMMIYFILCLVYIMVLVLNLRQRRFFR